MALLPNLVGTVEEVEAISVGYYAFRVTLRDCSRTYPNADLVAPQVVLLPRHPALVVDFSPGDRVSFYAFETGDGDAWEGEGHSVLPRKAGAR